MSDGGAHRDEADQTRALSPLTAALRDRCVQCGVAPASDGFLKNVEICPVCAADFRRHAAGDGAVYIVLTILCFVVMATVVSLEFAYRPPVWIHAMVGFGMTIGLALVLLPPVKRFMVAQSYAMDARGEGLPGPEHDPEADA